jgi:hypothetical protein
MKSQTSSQSNKNITSKTNIEDVIEDYRELIKEYASPTDDELVKRLQSLPSSDRNLMILFIASEYRYGIFARILGTNIKYGKNLIENIRTKIINMEL